MSDWKGDAIAALFGAVLGLALAGLIDLKPRALVIMPTFRLGFLTTHRRYPRT